MISLITQPMADRFGTAIQEALEEGPWTRLDAAVAWARRSGTRHLLPSLTAFLQRGGAARFAIGIDIENTSSEGLADLLSLEEVGNAETYIHHNEAEVTYHPKLYLLSNEAHGCLMVGSNNITEAGLFTNTEASVRFEEAITEPVFVQARAALDAWCDTQSGFALRLTAELIERLQAGGYVISEERLAEERARFRCSVRQDQRRPPLFRRQPITAPRPRVRRRERNAPGRVLIMRVRRASETARRTQIQLPKAVVQTRFFEGVNEIESVGDGRLHGIRQAQARGIVNTLKVEIPEIDRMDDPVLRLERTDTGIRYEAFDASSTSGQRIMDALRQGLGTNPPSTTLTKPSNPDSSTWWRFI
jgi:HKD family nuclease